ncbi:MAG: histidine kinase [Gammaproteobacteria bacterium]
MNLQFHMLSRIVVVALACLVVTSAFVLHRSDRQARQQTQDTAGSLSQQLELQLLRIQAGFGQARQFPDFTLWKQTGSVPGICVRFDSADRVATHSLCNGATPSDQEWPAIFEIVYRRLFSPGLKVTRPIALNNRVFGSLTVTPSAEMNIALAWNDIRDLTGLSAITVLAVCALVYLSINRALRPAGIIVEGLEQIEKGHLAYRLPTFDLLEWQRTSAAINQLAASQQRLLEDRQKLAIKLMKLQEEERRYLVRELHDEFGQCLAAITAVAASVAQTAEKKCPVLVDEAEQIGRISQHMMDSVRGLLRRLRPAELDELGLAASLNNLVSTWNAHSGGKTRFHLGIVGDSALLAGPVAITLYRIVQECLTNIAKHSAAANAQVMLATNADGVKLTVQDDGIANELPFADGPGIGLLGIRERVNALQGRLALSIAEPQGLIVNVAVPVPSMKAVRT